MKRRARHTVSLLSLFIEKMRHSRPCPSSVQPWADCPEVELHYPRSKARAAKHRRLALRSRTTTGGYRTWGRDWPQGTAAGHQHRGELEFLGGPSTTKLNAVRPTHHWSFGCCAASERPVFGNDRRQPTGFHDANDFAVRAIAGRSRLAGPRWSPLHGGGVVRGLERFARLRSRPVPRRARRRTLGS